MLSLYIFKYNNQHTGTQEKKKKSWTSRNRPIKNLETIIISHKPKT